MFDLTIDLYFLQDVQNLYLAVFFWALDNSLWVYYFKKWSIRRYCTKSDLYFCEKKKQTNKRNKNHDEQKLKMYDNEHKSSASWKVNTKTQNDNISDILKVQIYRLVFQTKLKLFTSRSLSKDSNFMKNYEYLI